MTKLFRMHNVTNHRVYYPNEIFTLSYVHSCLDAEGIPNRIYVNRRGSWNSLHFVSFVNFH